MDFEKFYSDLFSLINKLRTNPSSFVVDLEEMKNDFDGLKMKMKGSKMTIITREGVEAVNEAI